MNETRIEVRRLVKSPLFLASAVITLALGVGINVALVEATLKLLRDNLAIEEPDRLIRVEVGVDPTEPISGLILSLDDQRRVTEVLEASGHRVAGSAGISWASLVPSGESDAAVARLVTGHFATENYFDVIGVRAMLGQLLAQPPGAPARRAVLSHALWQALGGAPDVVGTQVRINGEQMTVVGVAEAGFKGLSKTARPFAVWMPLDAHGLVNKVRYFENEQRESLPNSLSTLVRLAPDTDVPAVESALAGMADDLETLAPSAAGEPRFLTFTPLSEDSPISERQSRALPLLLGAGMLVLAIACANIACLLLARSKGRANELAVRRSLGATTLGLVRLQLHEALFVTVLGTGLGIPLAVAALQAFWKLRSPRLAENAMEFGLSWRLGLLALAVSLLTVLVALLPAASAAARTNLTNVMKRGRSGRRIGWLIAVQVTFAVVVLFGAGLTLRSLSHLVEQPLGFSPDDIAVFTYEFESGGDNQDRASAITTQMLETLDAHPAVESAAISTMHYGNLLATMLELHDDAPAIFSAFNTVSEDYFETLGVRLERGRIFDARDTIGSPRVAVVNEEFARQAWPGTPVLGQSFEHQNELFEVVGVAANTKVFSFSEEPMPHLYLPLRQNYASRVLLNVKLRDSSANAMAQVRQVLAEVAPHQSYRFSRWEDWVRGSTWATRMAGSLLSLLGLVALVLVASGLFATLTIQVRDNFRELGIRLAVGSTPAGLRTRVLRLGMTPVLIGLAAGLGASTALAHWTQAMFNDIVTTDLLTYVMVIVLVVWTSLLATLAPAARAAATDPLELLRSE